ncbi:MAG: penicillin-binding protein 2, partial [Candidatus Omnitrophica bacterium]|nr:penicillin-binding protein 2 [Candidatus Omnitrophota bacterium]
MRLKIFLAAIVISFASLLAGLFHMQILKGEYYKNLSEQNRIVIIPLTAPRGKIYDRNKKLLVDNRVSFDASLIYKDAKDVEKLASLLSGTLKIDKKDLVSKILKAKSRPFAPITIVKDIGRKNAIILEQYRIDYPGLIVTTKPKRDYIYGNVASGIVGYLGKISEGELGRFKTYGYRMTDLVGRSGLEKRYNNYLRGTQGGMQVEIDSFGRQKNILHIKEPQIGKHLYLTIDIDLQEHCDNLMAEKRGCIIAMNPKSGEVFAFLSKPNFNPSIFIKPGPNEEVRKILGSRSDDYPLLNRGISCAYPPGSIFKTVVAAAALDTGKFSFDETFTCNGYYNLSKKVFRCWKEKGHGTQHIDEAIKNSCNVFFYQLGLRVGVENISLYAKKFGFGKPTYIDLPGEISGLVPTPQWKRLTKKEAWYGGDTVN